MDSALNEKARPQKQRAGTRPALFITANVEPKPRLHPYRTGPGFERGAAISENYFFVFFGFFAMMSSSSWTG
jgi:hypothetical protein